MAASYAASMQSIGLPALPPSACAEAFDRAGYSEKAILANLDISKFSQVNQVRSKWSYVSQLAMLPKVMLLQDALSHASKEGQFRSSRVPCGQPPLNAIAL